VSARVRQRQARATRLSNSPDLLARAVLPTRLALIQRGGETVAYNPRLNVWHRVPEDVAEVLRWLRAGRDRSALAMHLQRRFGSTVSAGRLAQIVQWLLLRRLLYLDAEPALPLKSRRGPGSIIAVYWVCTQACNLRCTYCYQDATMARPDELSTDEALALVDQVAEIAARAFVFTGGEPFSRRDLLTIAQYAKACGLVTNVISNGHHITERNVHEVARVFDRVTISLDSGIACHHDASRGQGSWSRAARAIDLLLDAGAAVDVNSVINRAGLDDLSELFGFLRKRQIGDHRIVPQSPMGRGADRRDDELSDEQMVGFEDQLFASGSSPRGVTKGRTRNHCGAGLSELSVDPEGWVFPCKLLQYPENRVGNVRESTLAQLVNTSSHLDEIRQPFTETLKPCSTCIIRTSCGGGCRGIHASHTKSWSAADPLQCAALRRNFELNAFASTGAVPPRTRSSFVRSDDDNDRMPTTSTTFIPLESLWR
jgi:radical SAM protein with 4Fe4S-binding SPASM domain